MSVDEEFVARILADAVGKLDRAIRILVEGRKEGTSQGVEVAIAEIESARETLTGRKAN